MTPADTEPQISLLAEETNGSAVVSKASPAGLPLQPPLKAKPHVGEKASSLGKPSALESRLQEAWLSTQLKPRQRNGKVSSPNPGVKRPRSPSGVPAVDLTSTLQSLWMQTQGSASGATPLPPLETSASESSTSPLQPPSAGAGLPAANSSRLLEEMLEEARREGGVLAPGGPGELDVTSEDFYRGLGDLEEAFQEMERLLGGSQAAAGRREGGNGAAGLKDPQGLFVGGEEGGSWEDGDAAPPHWLGPEEEGVGSVSAGHTDGDIDFVRIFEDSLARQGAGSGAAPGPKRQHEGVSDVSVASIEELGAEEAYTRIANECKEKQRRERRSTSGASSAEATSDPADGTLAETGEEWQDEDHPIPVLMKVAKAIVVGDQEKVGTLLARLNAMASEYGSAHQRLCVYFLEGLLQRVGEKERDDGCGGGGGGGSGARRHMSIQEALIWAGREEGEGSAPAAAVADASNFNFLENFHVLVTASPYLTFGQVASNSAILEACTGQPRIHIIDFGIAGGLQWPALLQALAARAGGPPHVRLTGVDTRTGSCQKTGTRLSALASAWGVPLEYEFVESALEDFELSMIRPSAGAWVAVNCALRIHKLADEFVDPSNPRNAFLRKMHALDPAIVTLVEQHTNLNSPFFLSRFYEALYYYYSMFAALDAALPGDVEARRVFERRVLGRAIINLVAYEGRDRVERQESLVHWKCRMGTVGFQPRAVSETVVATVTALLQTYKKGYGLLREEAGSLTLTWEDKPLLATTVWERQLFGEF